MDILVVTQYFYPENFKINDLVESFVNRGHRVTVLTSKPNFMKGINSPALSRRNITERISYAYLNLGERKLDR